MRSKIIPTLKQKSGTFKKIILLGLVCFLGYLIFQNFAYPYKNYPENLIVGKYLREGFAEMSVNNIGSVTTSSHQSVWQIHVVHDGKVYIYDVDPETFIKSEIGAKFNPYPTPDWNFD
jgi:hypothetical protein